MMGAGHVKAVYRRWAPHLPAQAVQLLCYIAVTMPDKNPRPRCEMSREAFAYGLGYTVFDDKADRAVKRAIASLKVAGALTVAQAHSPGRRAHYWVELSMDQGTEASPDTESDLDETGDGSVPREPPPPSMEQGTDLSGTGDGPVPCEAAATVLPTSGQDLQEQLRTPAGPQPDPLPPPTQPHLRALPGGGHVARKHAPDQAALWPAPVPDAPTVADRDSTPDVTAQTIVGEWIDRCRKRPPGQVVGQVAKHIRQMLAEGVDADDIRRGTAAWMAKGLHPAALPSVVNEVMNRGAVPPAGRPSTTDQRVAATLALGAKLQADHDRQAIGR